MIPLMLPQIYELISPLIIRSIFKEFNEALLHSLPYAPCYS
jgi:hypothetical protein